MYNTASSEQLARARMRTFWCVSLWSILYVPYIIPECVTATQYRFICEITFYTLLKPKKKKSNAHWQITCNSLNYELLLSSTSERFVVQNFVDFVGMFDAVCMQISWNWIMCEHSILYIVQRGMVSNVLRPQIEYNLFWRYRQTRLKFSNIYSTFIHLFLFFVFRRTEIKLYFMKNHKIRKCTFVHWLDLVVYMTAVFLSLHPYNRASEFPRKKNYIYLYHFFNVSTECDFHRINPSMHSFTWQEKLSFDRLFWQC